MVILIIFYILCYYKTNQSGFKSHEFNKLSVILEEFKIQHPQVVFGPGFRTTKFLRSYIKELNAKIITISEEHMVTTPQGYCNNLIFIDVGVEIEKYKKILQKLKTLTVVVIWSNVQFDKLFDLVKLEINQEIYFFKWSTNEIFETYVINGKLIKRKLGFMDPKTLEFIWEIGQNPDFFERRSNFHGITLRGMVEFRGLNLNADPKYLQNAPFYPNNQTYLVNGYTYGLMYDILEQLQNKFNFTTLLYKKKKEAWGYVYPQPNGSYIATGMVGDIFFKRSDLIVAPLALVYKRALYIDYLPPVTEFLCGVFIQNSDLSEHLDLDTFVAPFNYTLWMMILLSTFIIAVMKSISMKCYQQPVGFFDWIAFMWNSFIAFFGGKPSLTKVDSNLGYKMIVFSSLLGGFIIWICYRSSLTAELAVSLKKYPFQNMDTLSKTQWR